MACVLSAAGRVIAAMVTCFGGVVGCMAAARAMPVSPADGTIVLVVDEADLPTGAAAAGAAAGAAPPATSVIAGGGSSTAVGGEAASHRCSVPLFSAATTSVVWTLSAFTCRFSPFTRAAAVKAVTVAYPPAAPPATGAAVVGGDALPTCVLSVSIPCLSTRSWAATRYPAAFSTRRSRACRRGRGRRGCHQARPAPWTLPLRRAPSSRRPPCRRRWWPLRSPPSATTMPWPPAAAPRCRRGGGAAWRPSFAAPPPRLHGCPAEWTVQYTPCRRRHGRPAAARTPSCLPLALPCSWSTDAVSRGGAPPRSPWSPVPHTLVTPPSSPSPVPTHPIGAASVLPAGTAPGPCNGWLRAIVGHPSSCWSSKWRAPVGPYPLVSVVKVSGSEAAAGTGGRRSSVCRLQAACRIGHQDARRTTAWWN